MKYTKYVSALIRQFGGIYLHQEALRTVLNVIHLEAELKVYKSLNRENCYILKIHDIEQTIKLLTAGLEPKIFIEKLYNGELMRPPGKPHISTTKPWDEFDIYMTNPKKRQ